MPSRCMFLTLLLLVQVQAHAGLKDVYETLKKEAPKGVLQFEGANYPESKIKKVWESRRTERIDETKIKALFADVQELYRKHVFNLPYIKGSKLLKKWNNFKDTKFSIYPGLGAFAYPSDREVAYGRGWIIGAPSRVVQAFLLGHELKHIGMEFIPEGLNAEMKQLKLEYVDQSKFSAKEKEQAKFMYLFLRYPYIALDSSRLKEKQKQAAKDTMTVYQLLGRELQEEFKGSNEFIRPGNGAQAEEGWGSAAYKALKPWVKKCTDKKKLTEVKKILQTYKGLWDQREETAADFLGTIVATEFIKKTYQTLRQRRLAALSLLHFFPQEYALQEQIDVLALVGSKPPWEVRANTVYSYPSFQKLLRKK